ncbi:MAG: HAD-IB family hydrolase [Ilumatobacter sp.]|uniref:HAD-IB family hydrolase n=1 Tax=Ilumatobacter sp. TaxID=1967498 RepID=UPI0026139621|nr:HAD-IB family hydrolase [Ilumatobacter sp.]MDJ0770069.1 HAD-IB family hydrolase [Ilumatobacter sp.]
MASEPIIDDEVDDVDAGDDPDDDADIEWDGGAAFFDLDRTLLKGASGEVFSEAMRTAGLVTRTIPGEKFLYNLFNTVGETLPSMALARQAVTFAKGHSRAAAQAAAEGVADRLVDMVQPLAESVFEMHREAGRPVVLATTTPYDLVKPFADRLGLDDVIATRYSVDDDGDTYDGTLAGPFVWSAGKLEAARAWADEHGIDMGASYAYSDSVYDTPLLSAVGNPVVVNPDPRMIFMAAARRWPTLSLEDAPRRSRVGSGIEGVGLELQKIALTFTRPSMVPFADIDMHGVEHIPREGGVILVANHRSYFDASVVSMVVAKTGRSVRFLGKKEVFDAPVVGTLAAAMGGIRVDRGTGSDEPLQAAADALANGEMVAMMPQGTIPRGPAFFEPKLKGRWGAARLAQMSGATVIPIGLWGTEKVWPRSARLPNVLNIADAPTVLANVGEPVKLKGKSLDADTKRIMKAIVALLPPEAHERHDPTPDELASTYPPGYSGDPDGEHERRPGTD